jgi:hypothetical protein
VAEKVFRGIRSAIVYSAETLIETTTTGAFTVQNCRELMVFVKTENSGGTLPTLNIKWQKKMPDGTWMDFVPAIAHTEITGDTTQMKNNMLATYGTLIPIGQFVRFVLTIAGTSPTFDVTMSYIAKS